MTLPQMKPEDILGFWLDEVGPAGWYGEDAALDARIEREFAPLIERAASGGLSLWLTHPNGALAYIVVTDQFPRNVFRGQARAFATDRAGLAAAKMGIARGWDRRAEEPGRQFFYLPLMHSESLSDQDRCVRLMLDRLPGTGEDNLLHARAHRAVIRRFGRFPHRNEALGRETTGAEREFLEAGGYGAEVRALKAA